MQYTIVLEIAGGGGYTARCLELPAAISEGDTREEALVNIKEAIELVLEVTKEQAKVLARLLRLMLQVLEFPVTSGKNAIQTLTKLGFLVVRQNKRGTLRNY